MKSLWLAGKYICPACNGRGERLNSYSTTTCPECCGSGIASHYWSRYSLPIRVWLGLWNAFILWWNDVPGIRLYFLKMRIRFWWGIKIIRIRKYLEPKKF